MSFIKQHIWIVLMLTIGGSAMGANSGLFYREMNLIGGHASENEWVAQSQTLKNSVGFEDFRKYSNESGDFLTSDLQVRLAFDETEDRSDAWAIEVHNAWVEGRSPIGKVMAGHFDPAFGLEYVLDTHSTLLQTLAPRHLGYKKDWGVRLKHLLPRADLDVALQTGSGMNLRRKDNSHLATARLGFEQAGMGSFGVSFLYGQVLQSKGMGTIPPADLVIDRSIRKKRVGVDAQVSWLGWQWLGEALMGEDNQTNVAGFLIGSGRSVPRIKNTRLDWQLKSWINDLQRGGSDDTTLGLTLTHQITSALTGRVGLFSDLHKRSEDEQETILFQIYYYGRQ